MRHARALLAVLVLAAAATATVAFAGGPPACFGAASRDQIAECSNPSLELRVTPKPADALLMPGASCTLLTAREPRTCAFGTPKRRARSTIVMLGDSHGPAWRAAADTLVRGRRWRALSIARSSCPFAFAEQRRADPGRTVACERWIRAVHAWFARHPEIRTVLFVNSSLYEFTGREEAVAGYRAALDALPPSVANIVVIRANPRSFPSTFPCVERAIERREPAGTACAMPRSASLLPDRAAEAAPLLAGGRGHVIDLTDFFCDGEHCLPVVGGALVHKDTSHLNRVFSRTLGPYLAAGFRQLELARPG
jgi:hypothetical protein